MRLAFLTPARVNIIYISTDGCQKPQSLAPQGFQEFIFDTPIYSMPTHNYTIYRLAISLYCSIHISHSIWSFGFGAPHIVHTSLLCISYLHTMSVIAGGIGDKSSSPSYQRSSYHFSFASMTWFQSIKWQKQKRNGVCLVGMMGSMISPLCHLQSQTSFVSMRYKARKCV